MSIIEAACRISEQRERLERMLKTCKGIVDKRSNDGTLEMDDIDRVIRVELALATISIAEFMRHTNEC